MDDVSVRGPDDIPHRLAEVAIPHAADACDGAVRPETAIMPKEQRPSPIRPAPIKEVALAVVEREQMRAGPMPGSVARLRELFGCRCVHEATAISAAAS